MGGMLMVRYTSANVQDIGALIVCDARPVYGEEDQKRLQRTAQRPGREYETQEDYVAHFRIRPDGLRAAPNVHRYIAEFGCKQLPHGAWVHKIDRRTYAQRQMINTLPLYAQITCPVLFLWAAHSRVSAGMIQQLREACPHAEIAPRRRFRTPPDPRPTGADDPPRAGVFTAP
jgi:pimeloyl-ACP methyl ester carboxylesterase